MLEAPVSLDPSALGLVLACTVPLLLVLAAVLASRRAVPVADAWRIAQVAAATTLVVAGAALLCRLIWPANLASRVGPVLGGEPAAFAIVLLLIAFIGWVITRYAATYLSGEPRQHAFIRWLLLTLAGSSLVVATDNLGVLVFAWLVASVSLQRLLLFYPDRPQAQMAAHKKFLVSRLADICMVSAALLLLSRFGTLQIEELLHLVAAEAEVPAAAQVAVFLFAVAVTLKSAQLPFHGWLMQVMEAPTPVSALLHAGVVNLGGFVLIRLAPLLLLVPAAQVLLVIIGSLTAVLAVLVASTRISIKVALAWSTCAQMGFMLMQCGLGLFEMALLHLVAHSLYKAYAFLSSGDAVQKSIVLRMTPRIEPSSALKRIGAAVIAGVFVLAGSWVFGIRLAEQPGLAAMALVVSLSLTSLLAGRVAGSDTMWHLRSLATSMAVVLAYFGLHSLLHGWFVIGNSDVASMPQSWPLAIWIMLCFVLLFTVQTALALQPNGGFARRLHARFYGGLFLDEWFTRMTLRIWPVHRPASRAISIPSIRGDIA